LPAPFPFVVAVSLAIGMLPSALAVLLVRLMQDAKPPIWLRLGMPLGFVALVYGALLLNTTAFRELVQAFFYLLPVFGAFLLLGVVRLPSDPLRLTGAVLMLWSVWDPIYGNIPSFIQLLAGPGGAFEPLSVTRLYQDTLERYAFDVWIIVAGVLAYFEAFPFIQVHRDFVPALRRVAQRLRPYRTTTWWAAIGIGGLATLNTQVGEVIITRLASGSGLLNSGTNDQDLYANVDPFLVLAISFAAGLGEELVFRAVLQSRLEIVFTRLLRNRYIALVPAILVQATCFGFAHSGYLNFAHVLAPFVFGLIMGVVFRFVGLSAAVYAHALIDVFAFGSSSLNHYPWMALVLEFLFWGTIVGGLFAVTLRLVQDVSHGGRSALPPKP